MTNFLAAFLGIMILAAIAVDIFIYDTANLLFLTKKLADLVEWIAFWR